MMLLFVREWEMERGERMSRPKKFATAKALEKAWAEYKTWCSARPVTVRQFSARNSEFISGEFLHPVTLTIEGFCAWAKLSRSAFYDTYGSSEAFSDTVTRMREECEVDARMKFELGEIDAKLAGLWMSRYGYSTRSETDLSGAVPVILDDLKR